MPINNHALISKQYPTGITRLVIIVTTIVASLLELIDSTIVNVSLRHIAGSIGATTTDVAWIITAYAISNVIIIPLSGMLSEFIGRKRYYTFSILLFTFASLMCGNSGSLWEIVLWRFIQGLGGGALLALSQSILLESFPPNKIGLATAIYGMGVALGPALGPTIGGIITDNFSWNWIFYINVPLGMMAAIGAWAEVPDQLHRKIPDSVDWLGILLLSISVGSLQYVLEEGNSKNWFDDRNIILLTITAVVGSVLFIIYELKTKNPAVNLSLLKSRNLALGVFLNFGMLAMLFIGIYAFPLLVQIDLGWTATMTGLSLVPGAIVTSIGMILCQKLMAKGIKPRNIIAIGFIASFIFSALITFQSPNTSWGGMFIPQIFRGLSVGLYMLPAMTMAIEGLTGANLGQAVGLSNMARQLGGAVGLALIGNQINNTQALARSSLVSNISNFHTASTDAVGKLTIMFQNNGLSLDEARTACYSLLNAQVYKQSSMISYLTSFRIMAIISIIAFFAVLFIRDTKKS